jgi:hypothetical protein
MANDEKLLEIVEKIISTNHSKENLINLSLNQNITIKKNYLKKQALMI